MASRGVKVMEQRCWTCHGTDTAQSGLRLNGRDAILQGGSRGPAMVPGNAAQSRIIQAVRRTGDLSMPPGPKLPDAEVAALEAWIAAGAPWPATAPSASARATEWWSFRKPVRPSVPALNQQWGRNPIDAFIAAKLAENKL